MRCWYEFVFNAWNDIARLPFEKFDIVRVADATARLYSERYEKENKE